MEEADGGMVTMVVMRGVKVEMEEAVRVLNASKIEDQELKAGKLEEAVQVLKADKLEEAAQVLKAGKMEVCHLLWSMSAFLLVSIDFDQLDLTRTRNHSIPSPSTQVTQVEDSFQKGLSSGGGFGIEGLRIGANFPCRPGYGTRGSKVILWTNYFEIIPSQKLALYHYNVAVQPVATGKKLSRIIRLLLSLPEYGEFRDDRVRDIRSTLVSRRELLNINSDAAIQYQAEGEDQPRANAPKLSATRPGNGPLHRL